MPPNHLGSGFGANFASNLAQTLRLQKECLSGTGAPKATDETKATGEAKAVPGRVKDELVPPRARAEAAAIGQKNVVLGGEAARSPGEMARSMCTGPAELAQRAARAIADRLPPGLLSFLSQGGITVQLLPGCTEPPSAKMAALTSQSIAELEAIEGSGERTRVGCYNHLTSEILVKDLDPTTPGAFETTVVHELMHAFDRIASAEGERLSLSHNWVGAFIEHRELGLLPTRYAATNAGEAFAEVGAVYFGPHVCSEDGRRQERTLANLSPELRQRFESYVKAIGSESTPVSPPRAKIAIDAAHSMQAALRHAEQPSPGLRLLAAKEALVAAYVTGSKHYASYSLELLSPLVGSTRSIQLPNGALVPRRILIALRAEAQAMLNAS